MGILTKALMDSLGSADKVTQKVIVRLQKEIRKATNQVGTVGVVDLGGAVTAGESMKEGFKALFGKGQARADRAVISEFETPHGLVTVLVPVSGKDVLPTEFRGTVRLGAPGPAVLERGTLGSWSSGSWSGAPELDEAPETEAILALLKEEDRLSDGIEWDHELRGDLKIKLDWGLQVIPANEGETRLFMKTAPVGIFLKSLGVGLFLKKLDQLSTALKSSEAPVCEEAFEAIYPSLVQEA